jgi:hypothetical protein
MGSLEHPLQAEGASGSSPAPKPKPNGFPTKDHPIAMPKRGDNLPKIEHFARKCNPVRGKIARIA